MSDKMREAFEKWAITKSLDLRKDKDEWQRDRYYHSHVDAMWFAWQAAHAAALPPGFVAVPVEPTDEMIDAGCDAADAFRIDMASAYAAMLAARPEVK